MKRKRIIILLSLILTIVAILKLYQTYAVNITATDDIYTYDVNLNESAVVEVPSKSSKTIYYKTTNTNNGTLRYGIGYSSQSGLIVKYYEDSIDTHTGLIEMNENKFIKLKIINDTELDGEVIISTVLGYENNENLIAPSDVTLVTDKIAERNLMKDLHNNDPESGASYFLNTKIHKDSIESITTVKDSIVPSGIPKENIYDVSENSKQTVFAWYTDEDNDTLFEVFIGSDNGKITVDNCNNLFAYLSNLNFIDLTYLDTSEVTTFNAMFSGCSSLETLDLSSIDTSNGTSFASMFRTCTKLVSINLSSMVTTNATSMDSMFRSCNSLTSLDLSNFNTSNVKNMQYMFYDCRNLTTLNLSNFETSNVTTMLGMFRSCTGLTHLDARNFTFEQGLNTTSMFRSCSKLEHLDIRNANFNNLETFTGMFDSAKAGALIHVLNEDQVTWFQTNFSRMNNVNVY